MRTDTKGQRSPVDVRKGIQGDGREDCEIGDDNTSGEETETGSQEEE